MTCIKYSIIVLGLMISHTAFCQEQSFTNSIGMEFQLIKPGSMIVGRFQPPFPVPEDTIKKATHNRIMWMGDGRSYNKQEFDLAREYATRDARDGFAVLIGKAYYIGKYEVTQGQWKKIMGSNPSVFQHDSLANHGGADNHPVENVTMKDVKEFLVRLNKMEGKKIYRLPTEFEWEFAARAGREGDIPWNEITQMAHLGSYTTHPVGTKKPNDWGLHDMLGNVWEWVSDYYNEKIFADMTPPKKGKQHVLKGASISGDVKNATYMTHAGGPGNGWDVGFRVVMEIQE